MGKTTEEIQATVGKKRAIITLATAAVVAATPGVYSAWQSAKQEWKSKLKDEQEVRDKQENDLQKYVVANKDEIDRLRVSINDLRQNLNNSHSQLITAILLSSRVHPDVRSTLDKIAKKPVAKIKPTKSQPRPSLKPATLIRKRLMLQQREAKTIKHKADG